MGYDVVDVNGARQTGFTYSPGTLRDGLRCSTSKAYLRPCRDRDNLHVATRSYVEQILVDKNSKMAHGVRFRRGQLKYSVHANCEVILAAGSVQSPQLLMLSGIGPGHHLQEMGIPLVQHLPGVGQNLQDHVAIGGLSYLIDPPRDVYGKREFSFVLPKLLNVRSIFDFTRNETGPLYLVPECEAMAFVNTKYD